MTDADKIVVFSCKKCKETFEAQVEKAGNIFSCPTCEMINKIPGIARQKQATKNQLAEISKLSKKIKISSITLLIGICVLLPLCLFNKNPYLILFAVFIIIGCLASLCYYGVFAVRCLYGRNTGRLVALSIFFAIGLWLPIFISPIYIKLILNEKRLKKIELRQN
jgi:hypothetical protein